MDNKMMREVNKQVKEWKPDVVWFDYTYLWPLYSIFRKKNIPIITRSHNFEPLHFLEEEGRTFINRIKFVIKYLNERRTIKNDYRLFRNRLLATHYER